MLTVHSNWQIKKGEYPQSVTPVKIRRRNNKYMLPNARFPRPGRCPSPPSSCRRSWAREHCHRGAHGDKQKAQARSVKTPARSCPRPQLSLRERSAERFSHAANARKALRAKMCTSCRHGIVCTNTVFWKQGLITQGNVLSTTESHGTPTPVNKTDSRYRPRDFVQSGPLFPLMMSCKDNCFKSLHFPRRAL